MTCTLWWGGGKDGSKDRRTERGIQRKGEMWRRRNRRRGEKEEGATKIPRTPISPSEQLPAHFPTPRERMREIRSVVARN